MGIDGGADGGEQFEENARQGETGGVDGTSGRALRGVPRRHETRNQRRRKGDVRAAQKSTRQENETVEF